MRDTIDPDKRLRPRRPYRTYTPAERMGIMFMAMRDGIPTASRELGVPERTIQHWFARDEVGLREVRGWLREQAEGSYLRAVNAVHEEVQNRLEKGQVPQDELFKTFRGEIDARSRRSSSSPSGQTQAAAAARTDIHIHVDE